MLTNAVNVIFVTTPSSCPHGFDGSHMSCSVVKLAFELFGTEVRPLIVLSGWRWQFRATYSRKKWGSIHLVCEFLLPIVQEHLFHSLTTKNSQLCFLKILAKIQNYNLILDNLNFMLLLLFPKPYTKSICLPSFNVSMHLLDAEGRPLKTWIKFR